MVDACRREDHTPGATYASMIKAAIAIAAAPAHNSKPKEDAK
jgi:hypothetical protein